MSGELNPGVPRVADSGGHADRKIRAALAAFNEAQSDFLSAFLTYHAALDRFRAARRSLDAAIDAGLADCPATA